MTARPFRTEIGLLGRATRLAVVLGVFGIAGCSIPIPGQGAAPKLYTLSPKSTFDTALPRADWQLVVDVPVAAGGLNTNRIALQDKPIEVQYYALAQWTETAPQMVQTLLVESFENTGKIVAVGRQAIGLRSDFNLKSELREFQAEYRGTDKIPVVRVRINVKVIRQPERSIIASRNFEQRVTAGGSGMDDVVIGFDEALGKVLKEIVEWTLTNTS
ncbi:MAG: ABC-type transport auxiliary lipoprotein family protein [Proteobacteria bacterium]|nr:ABC-type transport auxiliary lipoprotein family protein [Pseudomonadota bacterium]